MAAGHPNLFVVRDRIDLARVIASFATARGSAPVVDISGEDAEAFGERDLRRLFVRARAAHVQLTLATDDPLLAELARIHGVSLDGAESAATLSVEPEPDLMADPGERHWRSALTTLRLQLINPDSQETDEVEGHSQQPVLGPTLNSVASPISGGSGATEAPPKPPRYGRDDETGSYSDASFTFVITPPTPRRPELAYPAAQPVAAPLRRPRARRGQQRLALFSVTALLGVVLGVGLILVGFLAPYTSVTLIPVTETLSAELTYGIAGGSTPLDLAVPPRTLAKTVTFEASIPTTGERFVPDQTATGELLFTNPTTVEIFVAAGTLLYTADGAEYATATDLTIPAADPFGSLTFGSASVQVTAGEPGNAGNQPAEALTGQLDSGVYYSNRSEIAGGTERRIAVVSQADKVALEQQALSWFESLGAAELADQLQPGEEFLSGSLAAGQPQLSFDQQVGADAAQLTVRGTVALSGAAYNAAELHAAAREALNSELTGLAPSGEVLIADSVDIGQPQPLGSAAPPTFMLNGTAATRAVISPEQLEEARAELVGADAQRAGEVVATLPGVASSQVEVGPGWLPFGRKPRLESRVTIEVIDEPSQPASTSQPTGP
jgi:hypothetical protein